MSDTEYPDDEGLVVLLRNEIDQLRARAEKAEADLAVAVEFLRAVCHRTARCSDWQLE